MRIAMQRSSLLISNPLIIKLNPKGSHGQFLPVPLGNSPATNGSNPVGSFLFTGSFAV